MAAAVVLLIAGSVWFLSTRQNQTPNNPAIASGNGHTTQPASPAAQTLAPTPDSGQSLAKSTPDLKGTTPDEKADINAEENEEMYHYAKLVEIKHKELKSIEKDEPLLYQQFSMDVDKLDSAYHSLQNQLPKNPNREQILEAMLQNLELQMGLLNHQLDIIKQINHSKKTAYEKAYKTT